jgi:hypothetical protein
LAEGHRQVRTFGFLLGQPQHRRVEVDTHNLALCPDEGGHPQCHLAAAASEVQDTHPGSQAGFVQ